MLAIIKLDCDGSSANAARVAESLIRPCCDCRRQAANIANSTGESTGPVGTSEPASDDGPNPTNDNTDDIIDACFGASFRGEGTIATTGAVVTATAD